ncbi:MAG: ATP-binding protein [Clostridiales bacterium]|nr:ATP-binding protein [Bacteroidales bacterium]MCC8098621.1 ATP-binding protein [Clostridiales bacterium]
MKLAGFPGIGKSTLALSAPRPLHIDVDFGIDRIAPRYRVPYIQPASYQEILDDLKAENLTDFDTLVFDTGGKLISLMSLWAIKQNAKYGQRDGSLSLKGYGFVGKEFVRLMDYCFYDLKKNIIVVFHAVEEKDGDNTKLRIKVEGQTKFSMMFCHSAVATNLENMKLLSYLKYTDKDGTQRDLTLGQVNGRLVLVDDSMPYEDVYEDDEYQYTQYTSYVLGDGAFEFTDVGAEVPYETDRDPNLNGGTDFLYSRQRWCYAPYGISFTQASMESESPTDEELENGDNWNLVSTTKDGETTYLNDKVIHIARILSRG